MNPEEKAFDNSVVGRGIKSLFKVKSSRIDKDILLKLVTSINLLKKSLGSQLPFTEWKFGECTIRIDFVGDSYYFRLPKGYDFNIYLNPYFHEYDVTQFVFQALSRGDTFIDVGAHAGLYTVIASKRVGPTGKLLSVEPNPLNLRFLELNIKLNNLLNVQVIPKALSDKSGKMNLFYSPKETAFTSLRKASNQSAIETAVTTIDDIAEEIQSVKIIKIDTEGNDLSVLKGASETLTRVSFLIVEQNTRGVQDLLSGMFRLTTLQPSGYLLATNKRLIMA
jgi:FkbM family methyltransferase